MTIITMCENEQEKATARGRLYGTLREARAVARKYGEEYEAVRVIDLYHKTFVAYAVEHK